MLGEIDMFANNFSLCELRPLSWAVESHRIPIRRNSHSRRGILSGSWDYLNQKRKFKNQENNEELGMSG